MCGIYGVIGERRDAERALDAIRRRGPDDRGVWSDSEAGVWFGHLRLSIIDPSAAGHQPMISPDGRVVMIYNGELYNFNELRRELEASGETFAGHSDSEVLLRLFAREGADCFARLNGIFAAAFWERDTRTLTLVRDPVGVKPLYLTQHGGRLSFASEMKALLRTGDAPPDIDATALLRHLCYLWSPGERTIARTITKLLPGHAAQFRAGQQLRNWRYRDTAPLSGSARPIEVDKAAELVANGIDAAVSRQMIADVPLGAFLSGGLDSSSVVTFARRHCAPRRLQCFTIETAGQALGGEGFQDDLPYARRVAEHLDVDLHVVAAGPEMIDRLPEMLYLLDEPTPDPAALNTLLISELAASMGIKVLLSGAGGDDVFTGYRRHAALAAERWWGNMPLPLRQVAARVGERMPAPNAVLRRASKALRYAGLDAEERLISYFFWLPPSEAVALLAPDIRRDVDERTVFAPLSNTLASASNDADPLERMLYLERRHFLADHNLNYTDKMGMAAGVEIRVPLLDLDLIDLANRIPVSLKQRGGTGKWILKRAMEPYLPRDVIYRPKSGFGVPLRHWLHGRLRPLVDDVLSPSRLSERGLFDPAAVNRLVTRDRNGQIDGTYPIFALLCIELWMRQHVDGNYALDALR